jgi:hypothetical protein
MPLDGGIGWELCTFCTQGRPRQMQRDFEPSFELSRFIHIGDEPLTPTTVRTRAAWGNLAVLRRP